MRPLRETRAGRVARTKGSPREAEAILCALWFRRTNAQTWRVGTDICRSFDCVLNRADLSDKWAPLAGPGGWNDPDMINVKDTFTAGQNRGERDSAPCRARVRFLQQQPPRLPRAMRFRTLGRFRHTPWASDRPPLPPPRPLDRPH